ncbi:hypothetical protein RUM43_004821 [Polyplax serrata]|uniref:Glutaminyl-peptide cyclotransferase n=1 Tax=Polyplax serrata TaxID=468196 RepID=A0AAN8XNT1_POLSC
MSCTPKGYLLWLITAIWLLSLIAFCLAQFSVSSSFAETWGCRFWTIELTMVGLTGYLIIWTCILTCFLLSSSPPPFLVLCFAITGLLMHLPNGITTLVDYMCGSESISASDYCTYSPVTMAVAILTTAIGALYGALTTSSSPLTESRLLHTPRTLSRDSLRAVISQTEDLSVFNVSLKNILVQRVVGTESHKRVQEYIIDSFQRLNWNIELDTFNAETPIGNLQFKNIIAIHNPKAKRFLDIACHYDSKYYPGKNNFVGATDSAVPCAMMIQIANNLNSALGRASNDDLSLRFIFFDGEEAFQSWSQYDSIYGARHLAEKWKRTPYPEGGPHATQLNRIDMLVLLDLLGAKNPEFYSFFSNTHRFYSMLAEAEGRLGEKRLLKSYGKRYFHRKSTDAYIEDDHLPFLAENVPIVHLITVPFPNVWHTPRDDIKIVDIPTTGNLIKILTVFISEYLRLYV